MSKRKILTLALALCMVAILAVSGTLAYFTAGDENTNTFTMGNVTIELDEQPVEKVEDEYVADPEAERVKENTYELIYPGATLPKDPIVHNTSDTMDIYTRVKISIENGVTFLPAILDKSANHSGPDFTETLYEEAFIAFVNETIGEGWVIVDYTDAFEAIMNSETTFEITLIYETRLVAGDSTEPVFTEIVIPAHWEQSDPRVAVLLDNEFEMEIIAEAIQAESFADAYAAFAAFDAE